jgi:hypothetical protein
VTSFLLSRLPEKIIADLAQISESNIRGIVLHLYKDVFDSGHVLYSINIDTDVKLFFCEVITNTQEGYKPDERISQDISDKIFFRLMRHPCLVLLLHQDDPFRAKYSFHSQGRCEAIKVGDRTPIEMAEELFTI